MSNRHPISTVLGIAAGLVLVQMATAGGQPPDIVINEIRIDQPGGDNDEYFELKGTPGTSLNGVTYVVIGDGLAAKGTGVIEEAVDLTGFSIAADGHFLVAEDKDTFGVLADLVLLAVGALSFENSDNVTHLIVFNFTGADGDDLDLNDDGILDVTPWDAIIDLIALIEEENPPTNTEFHYGPPTIGPVGIFPPGHVYRCEPLGVWTIGPLDPVGGADTPGSSNLEDCECLTDINGDGVTDVLDLIDLLLCFGLPDTPPCNTGQDVNGDGTVNVLDLIDLLLAFGQACP